MNDYITPEMKGRTRLDKLNDIHARITAQEENDINNKGFFQTSAYLITTYPVGLAGWFVHLGDTDTIWSWNGSAWVDSGLSPSQYYDITKIEEWWDGIATYQEATQTGGSSTAYTLATGTEVHDGAVVHLIPHIDSGANPTLAIDGDAPRAMGWNGLPMFDGFLKAGQVYPFRINGVSEVSFISTAVESTDTIGTITVGAGQDFTTIADAAAFLSNFIFYGYAAIIVDIKNGTYNITEALRLAHPSGMSITYAGESTAGVDIISSTDSVRLHGGFTKLTNVTLSGRAFITERAHVVLADVTVKDSTSYGLYVTQGAYLHSTAGLIVKDSLSTGVWITDSRFMVTGASILDNAQHGLVALASDGQLLSSTIRGVSAAGYHGLYVTNASNVVTLTCTIQDNDIGLLALNGSQTAGNVSSLSGNTTDYSPPVGTIGNQNSSVF